MRLNSESIETILERFDRRDDADADYVMAHWREAVDVYEHDGSMLDLDNIVRLETVLGDRIGYDAYHRINSTMEDLGEWLEQGLLVREASDGRLRRRPSQLDPRTIGRMDPNRAHRRRRPLHVDGWIGNGVLDRFLEDESLFGEFLRTPVSEGGVEPLVVEPPHVVVEVGA